MGKVIRKTLFGDLFNILEYEEYFSEMSREGFHLQKIGRYFAYFEEGKPNYLNYKIDIVKKDEKEFKIITPEEHQANYLKVKYGIAA